ncbi:MAG: diguanylate cyclase [Gammaproteobacteria bacterium]
MKSIIATLEKLSRKAVFSISLFLVFILGISQYLMHGAINLDPVYILPVIISSWYGSKLSGIWVSLFSVLVLGVIEWGFWQGSLQITERLVFIGSHLATFLLAALIVTYFSITHRIEVDAADTDTLTGVHSVRSLQVELNNVLLRSKRYNRAFSLAYIDIDNFKKINDLHGHSTGLLLTRFINRNYKKSFLPLPGCLFAAMMCHGGYLFLLPVVILMSE